MPFRVTCPSCDHELNLRDDLLGKRVRCPSCKEAVTAEPAANRHEKPASPIRDKDVKVPTSRVKRGADIESDETDAAPKKKKKRKGEKSRGRGFPLGLVLGGAAAVVTVVTLVSIVILLVRSPNPSSPPAPQASLKNGKANQFRVADPLPFDPLAQASKGKVPDAPPPKKVRPKRPAPQIDLSKIGTAAIVDLSANPAGALFEAKVVTTNKLTWVERTQIDKVLGEQDLQALFHAEGGPKRVNLGKILKADMLVLLRSGTTQPQDKGEAKSPTLDLVVCECRHGLRVAAQSAAIKGTAEEQVAELEGILRDAMGKLSEKITDVCAVPPFINQDLDFQHNHLTAAFSRLLEQHLLRRKGVLMVELAEAQALTKEASVAGGDLERPLPLYFMGDFRNEGIGEARRVTVNLKLQRGEKVFGERQQKLLAPGEASKTLLRLADELVDPILASPSAGIIDPDAEVAQLDERAASFQRLGNWTESLGLLEAAILIDPEATDLRMRAARVAATEVVTLAGRGRRDSKAAFQALHLHRRALDHMELAYQRAFAWDPKRGAAAEPNLPGVPFVAFEAADCLQELSRRMLYIAPDDLRQLFVETKKAERAAYLKLFRLRVKADAGGQIMLFGRALADLPRKVVADTARSLIQEFKNLPQATRQIVALLTMQVKFGEDLVAVIECDPGIIDELAADPHPEIRAAAEPMRIELPRYLEMTAARNAANMSLNRPPTPVAGTSPAISLPRVQLDFPDGNKIRHSFNHVIPLGTRGDLFVAGTSLFVMREKGVAERIWTLPTGAIETICHDGRFVWVTGVRFFESPRVFVIDPGSKQAVEFTEADGMTVVAQEKLPDKSTFQAIQAAPLDPGRVMLVGSFGRTWFAIATFDPEKGKSCKVFHEARDIVTYEDKDVWQRTTVAFKPSKLFVISSGSGERRVVVCRQCRNHDVESHPLLVDPEKLAFDVTKQKMRQDFERGFLHDGSVYFTGYGGKTTQRLEKFSFPGHESTTVMTPVPDGSILGIRGDDIFIVTETQYWQGSFSAKTFRPIGPVAQNQRHVGGLSNHYGFLLSVTQSPNTGIYQLAADKR